MTHHEEDGAIHAATEDLKNWLTRQGLKSCDREDPDQHSL